MIERRSLRVESVALWLIGWTSFLALRGPCGLASGTLSRIHSLLVFIHALSGSLLIEGHGLFMMTHSSIRMFRLILSLHLSRLLLRSLVVMRLKVMRTHDFLFQAFSLQLFACSICKSYLRGRALRLLLLQWNLLDMFARFTCYYLGRVSYWQLLRLDIRPSNFLRWRITYWSTVFISLQICFAISIFR